jgi:hypothetical protein
MQTRSLHFSTMAKVITLISGRSKTQEAELTDFHHVPGTQDQIAKWRMHSSASFWTIAALAEAYQKDASSVTGAPFHSKESVLGCHLNRHYQPSLKPP